MKSKSTVSASALATAMASGLLLAASPASAACIYNASYGGLVCTGSNSGIVDPGLNNSKIQVQGGAVVTHFADAIQIGSNNTVDSAGRINGHDDGISTTGNLVFNNTGEILGRLAAVRVSTGDLEMTNTNNVSSGGIAVIAAGQVKLTNSGSMSGANGVQGSAVTVFNSGSLGGVYHAVSATGDINIRNDGTIGASNPAGLAVNAGGNATVTTNGSMSGAFAAAGTLQVTNNGEINGPAVIPIFHPGFQDNGGGLQPGAAAQFILANSGKITGTGIVNASPGSEITITNSGTITNNGAIGNMPTAIVGSGAKIALTNSGIINSTSTGGLIDGGDVTVTNSHKITSAAAGAVIRGSTLAAENTGELISQSLGATILQSTGAITVRNGGTISGAAATTAIQAAGDGEIVNTGSIRVGPSTTPAANSYAIRIAGLAKVTNEGTITAGGAHGAIAISVGDKSEIVNKGQIDVSGGTFPAIQGLGALSVTNTGDIKVAGDYSTAITAAGKLNLNNSGLIEAGGLGTPAIFAAGEAAIVNSGRISASGTSAFGVYTDASAIFAREATSIVNSGHIESANGNGVTAFKSLDVTNSGRIEGAIGIYVEPGAGPARIANNGLIIGASGVAISLTNAADELTLGSGSRIQGLIKLGGGADTVNVALATGKSRLIVFDDLTNATVNVTGTPAWQIAGNALVSLDATTLLMRHASLSDVRNSIGDILENRVSGRLYQGDPSRTFYLKTFGGGGSYGANKGAATFGTRHFGLIAGVEATPAPNAVIGGFAGGAFGSASASGAFADSTKATYMLTGLYGRVTHGMLYADANVVAGYASASTKLNIISNVGAGGVETLSSGNSGLFLSPEIGFGVKVPLNEETSVVPGIRYRYTTSSTGKSSKTSASGLSVNSGAASSSEIRGQVQVSHEARLPGALFKMQFTTGVLFESVNTGSFRIAYNGQALTPAKTGSTRNTGIFATTGFEWRDQSGLSYFAALQGDWRSNQSFRFGGRGGVKFDF
ncbi:MAG: autotransporter domain-containing protein [Hyphomicrobiales bacterium]|nr:autotransporter domain-containing protein [Hyphomicrobiales bacterium]